jgi:hypothetical protein
MSETLRLGCAQVAELTRHAARMLREGEMTVLLAGDWPDGLALLRFRPSVWAEKPAALATPPGSS